MKCDGCRLSLTNEIQRDFEKISLAMGFVPDYVANQDTRGFVSYISTNGNENKIYFVGEQFRVRLMK